jgi:leader peptidase (prepilin peptidase)/N-methyltransferase
MLTQLPFGLTLCAIVTLITWTDSRQLIIPDALNLGLAAFGGIYQLATAPDSLGFHILAAVGAYALFWLVRDAHRRLTGRLGLGLGDVKMIAAAMLWIEVWSLPIFIFAASASALIFVIGRGLAGTHMHVSTRQPFGPFLGLGLIAAWLAERTLPGL